MAIYKIEFEMHRNGFYEFDLVNTDNTLRRSVRLPQGATEIEVNELIDKTRSEIEDETDVVNLVIAKIQMLNAAELAKREVE